MGQNLWGNLDGLIEGIKNPKELLDEQAEYLEKQFNGLVKCRILRIELREEWKKFYQNLGGESDFIYSFKLYSDYVEKYGYEICTLAYGIKMYPVAISFGEGIAEELNNDLKIEDGDTIIVKDEKELYVVLGKILTSKEVHQVLRGLLSIAKKEKESQEWPF